MRRWHAASGPSLKPRHAVQPSANATTGIAIHPVIERTQITSDNTIAAARIDSATRARRGPCTTAINSAPTIGGARRPPAATNARGTPLPAYEYAKPDAFEKIFNSVNRPPRINAVSPWPISWTQVVNSVSG